MMMLIAPAIVANASRLAEHFFEVFLRGGAGEFREMVGHGGGV
jgi:hypothetical protein